MTHVTTDLGSLWYIDQFNGRIFRSGSPREARQLSCVIMKVGSISRVSIETILIEMYYVIGSGPAGISCAQALIAAGKNVTILDSGLQLEDERRDAVRTLALSNYF